MTIKTLEYIHALLIEDERKRKEVYENSRRLQREYEENGADEELINRQDEDAGKFMREHFAALNALEDFEGKSGKEAQSMGLMIDKPAKTLIERFAQKQPGGHFACPRCGKMTMDAESVTHNALSRRIGCYICDTCGTVEALEDFAHKQNSLNVWAITKEPELWRMLSWNSDGIEIAGHEGTWYVIDEGDFQITPDVDGKPETLTAHLFLLESELYGEDAAGLIVNDEKQIVMEDVWNGFDDLEDAGWEEVRKIECPVCKGEFLREDMTFTRDCHGITFRLVCFGCYEKVMAKGYDGAYYTEVDECIEEDY